MAHGWDIAGVFVEGIGAAAVVCTLIFTGIQVRDARQALEATTLYNVEKDFLDVFKPITTQDFQKCFGKESNHRTDIVTPNPCELQPERDYLYAILSYYRLLLDLEEHNSLEKDYVSGRIQGACDFLGTDGTRDTISVFREKATIDPSRTSPTGGTWRG